MEICREALERRQEGKAGMGAGHKDHGRTILGMPLGLYLGVLALTSVCMYMGCVPKSLVPAFLVLMVFGEGLNAIGNTVPVGKTYLRFSDLHPGSSGHPGGGTAAGADV